MGKSTRYVGCMWTRRRLRRRSRKDVGRSACWESLRTVQNRWGNSSSGTAPAAARTRELCER
jgi:hypothetical protein